MYPLFPSATRCRSLEVGILARYRGERLGMHREHRAQLLERALREGLRRSAVVSVVLPVRLRHAEVEVAVADAVDVVDGAAGGVGALDRSEEHTSELQSLMRISYAVFCLKKTNNMKEQQRYTLRT